MKAMVCTKYGPSDVLQLGEVKKPVVLTVDVMTENRQENIWPG
jgi:hypothetical protein